MVKIRKICYQYDDKLKDMIAYLLSNYDNRINPKLISGHITDTVRGRSYSRDSFITVPRWAYKFHHDYFMYYTAHELSHIITWRRYRSRGHGKDFYKIFCKLCPKEVQHFELDYKKRSSIYGVKNH